MAKLIDKLVLLESLERQSEEIEKWDASREEVDFGLAAMSLAKFTVSSMQEEDAEPVIRCYNCKFFEKSKTDVTEHVCYWGGYRKKPYDYCSMAERKEEHD